MAYHHPLPNNLNPTGDICVPLFVPDDPDYIALLIKAIRRLENHRHYQPNADHDGQIVRDNWSARTITPLIDALANGTHCGACITMWPFHPSIEFFPNDPYTEPDLVTEGYIFPAWYIAGTIAQIVYDAELHSAISTLERLPPGSLPTILPASGLPRFRVHVNGTGIVELHLVAVNAGGMMQITVDDDILTLDLVDTNQDKLGIPPELHNVIVIEVEITTPGDHHIDCIIIPMVQDGFPPLLYGGGLFKVEMCGFSPQFPGTGKDLDGLQIRLDSECGMEFSTDGGTEWEPVIGWDTYGAGCWLGDTGATGATGAKGDTGDTGAAGADGADGEDGEDGNDGNTYPPPPSPETDEMCGASWYTANQIEQLILATIEDALTLTFEEFIEGLFGIGGFDGSWVKAWWDFIIASGNPTLGAEVTASIEEVAEYFYCHEFDRELIYTSIDDSVTITEDAQAAWIGAIRTVDDSKLALWAFIGSQDVTQDCVDWCATVGTFQKEFDFTVSDGGWKNMSGHARPFGVWENGVGWKSEWGGAGVGIPDAERLYLEIEGWNDRHLTKIEAYFTSTGTTDGVGSDQILVFRLDDVQIHIGNWGGFVVPNTWMETWSGDYLTDELWIITNDDPSSDTDEIVCTKIIIWGDGSDPF